MFTSQEGFCINSVTTSRSSLYEFSQVFVKGISDRHLMAYIMLKSACTKLELKIFKETFLQRYQ